MVRRGRNLLLDLPDNIAKKVWMILVEDDARAVLRLETMSKSLRHQLRCVAVHCRFDILYQHHIADHAALAKLVDSPKVAAGLSLTVHRETALQQLARTRAAAACQASLHRRHSLRQSMLEQYGYTLSPKCLAHFKKVEDHTEQLDLQACDQVCLSLDLQLARLRFMMCIESILAGQSAP